MSNSETYIDMNDHDSDAEIQDLNAQNATLENGNNSPQTWLNPLNEEKFEKEQDNLDQEEKQLIQEIEANEKYKKQLIQEIEANEKDVKEAETVEDNEEKEEEKKQDGTLFYEEAFKKRIKTLMCESDLSNQMVRDELKRFVHD